MTESSSRPVIRTANPVLQDWVVHSQLLRKAKVLMQVDTGVQLILHHDPEVAYCVENGVGVVGGSGIRRHPAPYGTTYGVRGMVPGFLHLP